MNCNPQASSFHPETAATLAPLPAPARDFAQQSPFDCVTFRSSPSEFRRMERLMSGMKVVLILILTGVIQK